MHALFYGYSPLGALALLWGYARHIYATSKAVKHADAGDALVSCANFLLDEKLYEGQAKKQHKT